MTNARERCWIHEDCVANPELGAACGPNVPDMPALDSDQWYKGVFGGVYERGDGCDGIQGDGHLLCAPDGDGQCTYIDIHRNSLGDGFGGGDLMGQQWP